MTPTESPTESLPEMSRHEASWHEHVAGMRAAEAARNQGGDPAVIEAIASATVGPREIGRYKLRPANQATIWTLQRIAREFGKYADDKQIPSSGDAMNPGSREILEIGLATLAFIDARQVWKALDGGDLAGIIEQAEEMMWETPLDVQMALQKHFQTEMDRIAQLAPKDSTPKKPEPAATPAAPNPTPGSSPAVPTQAPATASPPANGMPPNMG